ncbi:putative hemin transport protein [Neisseria sp. HSC-16F19]|nr:ChuX/HutX family heme-like substrate-binding protein [Neisseria sp. HSC-16F19]MCP2040331.1 putative hemin transport protein [Neisseria sp. HSC-16F19]
MTPLWQQYQDLKAAADGPYFPREGAAALGVSEGELMAAAPDTVYLGRACGDIVQQLHTLGQVEAIVRNSVAVHERKGVYDNVRWSEQGGIALNIGGIDLRLFTRHWHHALAVTGQARGEVSRSIQFYDEYGTALQKVFLRDPAALPAWQALLDTFGQSGAPGFQAAPPPSVTIPPPLDDTQLAAFHQGWQALTDVHQFGGLLERFGIDRLTAYQQAPAGMARRLDNGVWERVLEQVRDCGMELMVFVGNRGLVQIQTGPVHKVVRARGYLNVLDGASTGFNLHLQDSTIAESWVVRRPVAGGFVTCIEGLDEHRRTVVQFFGRRKEGEPELAAWQAMTDALLNG